MGLKLAFIDYKTAKYAVESWHYSEKIPTSKMVKIGVWEDESFRGAIIFGVGACNNLVKPYGLKNYEGCELVRIALRSHKTPVSRIISIALKLLKKECPGLKMVVSFADMKQNHHGGIYQASNWIYAGKTPPSNSPIINGQIRHPRVVGLMIHAGKAKSRDDFNWVKGPQKHRYLYAFDNKMMEKLQKIAKPYPKRE